MREKGFIQAIKKIELVEKKVSRQICKLSLMKFQIKIKVLNMAAL
jgi:hypothetical protein